MALRTVLITGANSGVGYATATLLSSFPTYHVIMTGRSLPKLQAAKQVIEATGTVQSQLSILHLDVTDLSTITAAAKQVEEQHGHLDVLINNAATGIRIPDMQTRLTEAYKTNVIGPALVSEAFRPLLLKSANPYSLYISSGVGSINLAMKKSAYKMQYEDAYRSSKAALNMLATLEYTDFKEQGLKVFVVSLEG